LLRRRVRRKILRRTVFAGALLAVFVLVPTAGAVTQVDVSVTIVGTQGTNGWYRSNVTVNWTWSGAERTEGCETKTLTVDTPGTKLTCTAWNDTEGSSVSKSVTIKLDRTIPSVTAAPDRQPDANGWYNRALTVAYSGTDGTSGVASCSAASQYGGPDNERASVAGACTDNAGNMATVSHAFKYDATPPTLFAVTARLGNRSAQVAWRKSSDTQVVEVLRAPGRSGQGETMVFRGDATGFRDMGLAIGQKYEYRVTGIDEAANRAERKLDLVATGPLLSPAPGAQVKAPPYLIWTPVKRATYYNVQLIRGGRRVLSAWPVRPSFRLRRTWTYKGRRYRLKPGVYRWYVWPGFGRISASRYSPQPLGSSTFVVAG
jgi:hypothetical protein